MNTNKRVLLVDDDPFLRKVVARLIRDWSYTVTAAESLQTAKDAFSNEPPFGIIVSDYLLPDGTGVDFFAWLRQEKKSDVPFLLVSGSYAPSEATAYEYLAKPYRPQELRRLIEKLIEPAASEKLMEPAASFLRNCVARTGPGPGSGGGTRPETAGAGHFKSRRDSPDNPGTHFALH